MYACDLTEKGSILLDWTSSCRSFSPPSQDITRLVVEYHATQKTKWVGQFWPQYAKVKSLDSHRQGSRRHHFCRGKTVPMILSDTSQRLISDADIRKVPHGRSQSRQQQGSAQLPLWESGLRRSVYSVCHIIAPDSDVPPGGSIDERRRLPHQNDEK